MKRTTPENVNKYCYAPKNDDAYLRLAQEYEDGYTFVYKIKCICENQHFFVYKDKHPTVELKCNKCSEHISVYDLKYYPCAVKLNKEYPLKLVSNDLYCVYVVFEYSNESEDEEDVPFDDNDITWCYIYIKNIIANEVIELINDETA